MAITERPSGYTPTTQHNTTTLTPHNTTTLTPHVCRGITPKDHSGVRQCVRVQLIKNDKIVLAFIPGDGTATWVSVNVCPLTIETPPL